MNYKHSTYYVDRKGRKRIYTTISDTDMHCHLCEKFNGKTYRHPVNDTLYFVPGMPLPTGPLHGEEVKR